MKKILIFGLVAAAGWFIYEKYFKNGDTGLPDINSSDANALKSQPSQIAPITTNFDKRVDGDVSQPWNLFTKDVISMLSDIEADSSISGLTEFLNQSGITVNPSYIKFV